MQNGNDANKIAVNVELHLTEARDGEIDDCRSPAS
jgi:hypothetical protein